MGGSRLARYALSNGWSEREVRWRDTSKDMYHKRGGGGGEMGQASTPPMGHS